jgi:hypothetical protein
MAKMAGMAGNNGENGEEISINNECQQWHGINRNGNNNQRNGVAANEDNSHLICKQSSASISAPAIMASRRWPASIK